MGKGQDFFDKLTDFFNVHVRPVVMRPIIRKPFNTAWQAFLAVWLATGLSVNKTTLIAALAAALSAGKTALLNALRGDS